LAAISEVLTASIIMVIALMMEAASTSETSVNFYETTRRNIPEDSHLHTRRRKNLKSLMKRLVCFEQMCSNTLHGAFTLTGDVDNHIYRTSENE
jgi:hypothetical protein